MVSNDTKKQVHPVFMPFEAANQKLKSFVQPESWQNPKPAGRYDLVVIGAGTAGLVSAMGAAGLGAKVALVEKNLMGGDCLNVGCVPSKSIISSARLIGQLRTCHEKGIEGVGDYKVDFQKIMTRMREIRAQISPADSAQRFQEAGVDVFFGNAAFIDGKSIKVNDMHLKFRKAVIATGARALVPTIQGLKDVGFLTNETVFSLTALPKRLAIIGAGPIGCELAQAFSRFGSKVKLIQNEGQFLPREDKDAATILENQFKKEGIEIILNAEVKKVEKREDSKLLFVDIGESKQTLEVDEIIVSAGRVPNVEDLNLAAVQVDYDPNQGVFVDDRLQTTNKRIFAAGDVCLQYKFTHMADAAARIVLTNALFLPKPFGAKASTLTVPWCTYTEPEIAHVGLYRHQVEQQNMAVQEFVTEFSKVDRAIVEGEQSGFVRILIKKGSDRILGATIVGEGAGDLISEISLAIVHNIGLGAIASVIHPYPTRAEAIKKCADAFNRTRLTSRTKKWLNLWFHLARKLS